MKAIAVSAGERFGRLVVLHEGERSKAHRRFMCRCDCGADVLVYLSALRSGLSRSCGCLRQERATTHGESWQERRSPEWKTWVGMRARCRSNHKNYGGRGIKVCERWDRSFEAFLADMGRKPPRTSLDRINNDGDYEPENCRWAKMRTQLRNTRRNLWMWYKGRRCLLVDVAEAEGFNVHTLRIRRMRGWPDSRLLEPVNPKYAERPQSKK